MSDLQQMVKKQSEELELLRREIERRELMKTTIPIATRETNPILRKSSATIDNSHSLQVSFSMGDNDENDDNLFSALEVPIPIPESPNQELAQEDLVVQNDDEIVSIDSKDDEGDNQVLAQPSYANSVELFFTSKLNDDLLQ